MSSIRSQIFAWVLRNKHFFEGKLKRTHSVDFNTSIEKLRNDVEKGAGFFGKLPEGFLLEAFKINGLPAEWMLPPGVKKDAVILYFHGGGLVLGSIKAHRSIVAKFVKGSNIPALVIDYALAPENPFPAALRDCIESYKYLINSGIKEKNIVFMGDSGGGNLVFATLLKIKESGLKMPAGAVALSPWTDLTNSGNSYNTNALKDSITWKEAQHVFSTYYCGAHDPKNPLISPLFGELHGLPPIQVYAGNDELMRDDSVRFVEKAQKSGVQAELFIGEGLFHCYPACAPLFPEATEALNRICEFIQQVAGIK